MKSEIELAYVGIEVPDPAALDGFFGEVIGLVPGDAPHTWRTDGKARRIIVEPGAANDAAYVGFEVADADALERYVARLESAGFEVSSGDASARKASRLVRTLAPWGVSVEIVLGLENAQAPFESPLVPGGFHTEGVGLGHVVFATTRFDESHRFLVDGLGMRQSDWLEMEIAPGFEIEVHFYHCNARHHSMALVQTPAELPQKLHHLMLETNVMDDVGRVFDRVWETSLAIPNGLGRHPNDGMLSFYVASPAGFQVEIGHGAKVITEPWDQNRCYDRRSIWGHQQFR